MKLIEFKEQTVIIAKDQPEYTPLPAYQHRDQPDTITFCWKLSLIERLKVLLTGKVWHSVLTFNQSLQPVMLQVNKPAMPKWEAVLRSDGSVAGYYTADEVGARQ